MSVLKDTFTDTAGTLISAHTADSGGTYSLHPTTSGTAVITAAGRSRAQSGVSALYKMSATAAAATQWIRCQHNFITYSAGSTNFAAIFGRLDPTVFTGYFLSPYQGTWSVSKIIAGSNTSLASFADSSIIAGAFYDVRMLLQTNSQKGFINRVLRMSSTDASITTGTIGGLYYAGVETDSTGQQIDNVSFGNAQTGTFTASGTLTSGGGSSTVTLTGTGTNWTTADTDFAIDAASAGRGCAITGVTIASTTSATLTVTPGTTGTITLYDQEVGSSTTIFVGGSIGPETITTSASATAVTVTGVAETGGTAPWSYLLHRSTTSNFTPTGSTAGTGTCLLVQASAVFTDSTAVAGTPYYYRIVAKDSAGTPNVVTSNQACGVRLLSLVVGCIGDSLTHGALASNPATTGPVAKMATYLGGQLPAYAVSTVEHGVGGSQTVDWLPTSTRQESGSQVAGTGSTATNLYNNAKTAFQSAGVNAIHIMLGTNDGAGRVTGPTYSSNLTALISQVKTDFPGAPIFLSCPPYAIPGTSYAGVDENLLPYLQTTYPSIIASLCDGTTVFQGDSEIYAATANNTSTFFQSDGVHFLDAGYDRLGQVWSARVASIKYPVNVALLGAGPNPTTLTFTSDGTTAIANASVWITSDSSGLIPITGVLTTDASGHATFNLTTGTTYYANLQASGYRIRNQSFTA